MITQFTVLAGVDIVRNGKTRQGAKVLCREKICESRTFILDYAYAGQSRQVKTDSGNGQSQRNSRYG